MNKAVLLDDTVATENYNLRVAVEEGTFCHRWATGFLGGMTTDEVKGPTSRKKREKRSTQLRVGYYETVIVAGGVPTMLPIAAVMVTVPPVVRPATIETVPADTVASCCSKSKSQHW
jgi:hypothetical protein